MSLNISTATIQQYTANVTMLLQQQGSRLRSSVTPYSFTGKAATMCEQFGEATAVRNLSRHSDTPLTSVPQDRRWVYPNDYDFAELTDNQDLLRTLIDPTGEFTKAGAMALGRGIDDEIIYGLFNSNNTGENGTVATGLLSAYNGGSQVVGANVGASSNTGLNVAKLQAAMEILMASEVDIENDQLFMAITAKQHRNLLAEAQATSLDYQTTPVLEKGKISSFMGFTFIHSERIPGAARFNTAMNPSLTGYTTGSQWMVPFWAKSGVALGTWNDITTSVDRRPDKRNSMQVYVTGTFGGARLEEKRCGFITCV